MVLQEGNRYLLEVVCALLLEPNAPVSYWGKALFSVIYLINHVLSAVLDFQTPFDVLTKVVLAPIVQNCSLEYLDVLHLFICAKKNGTSYNFVF